MSHTLLPSTALVVFLLLTGLLRDALAQSTDAEIEERYHKEHGNFFFRNYSSKDYKNASDNWGVLEDKSGNMIFANGNGLMIYDGKTWTLIETPTQSVIRSMVHDQDGRLYIGALDDVGYLSQTPYGKNIYVSLLDSIPPDQRQMGNVWSTHLLNNEIYFESEAGLYIWNKKAFRFIPWVTPGAWHKSFVWNNHLYLSEEGTGLLMLNGNQFTAAEGGSDFKTRRIYTAMPVNQHQIIFGTKFDGLFSYNGHYAVPIISDATPYFKEFEIYAGISLGNKTLAVASKFGGVLIINAAGKVLSMISRDQGLKTNNVRALAADRNGDLWMALDEGLSHIEISNGLEYYDESAGLASAVNDIIRFGDRIYINNNTGTYVLVPSELPNRRARFQRIDIPKEAGSWGFLEVNKRLLISTSVGVFELNDNKLMQLTRAAAFALLKLKGDSSRILIAEEQSIQSLRLKDGKWIPAVGVPDMHIDNVKFNETIAGKVWITTFSQGATLISYQKDNSVVNYDKPVVTRYGTADGLPEGFIKISSVHDYESFRVGTESLLLKFDYKTNRFVPDSLFTKTFGFNIPVFPTNNASADGDFLMKAKKRDDGIRKIFVVNRDQSGYKSEHFDMSRITENVGVMTYWDRANNEIWHVGMEMMVRQKLIHPRRDTSNFNAHLNKIIINGDSVLYEGTGASPIKSVVPHALSSFRFEFTSNNFVAESQNVFQYKLQGYDDEWSEWSSESIKEYSRLWEGDYIFLVRSKDYAGVISREDKFSFIVRPPWYRSILAFIAYAAIVAFAIWNLLRWRSRKLEKEKIALQKEIDLQTQEIRTQNVRLGEQSEELRINAEQLKELDTMKSNFFVNISHEFRTPLSLILGPLEKVMENHASGVRLPELQRMHRSAKRLQQLINQLLDLAKLEAGQMKVVERQQDVLYHLRVLTASFESLADVRNIKYDVTIPIGSFDASLDVDKFETIIYNLLSNAFKFTPEGGTISIACTLEIQEISLLTIKITDNGPGIPESAIDKIFNRFYQVDSSSSREYEGSGIGLSLVKELITLLNGDVQVESKHGEGTSFTVSLPMQGNLLIEDELLQNELSASGFANIAQGMANDNTVQSASEELILIVEDNADLRAYLQESLQSDYNIEVAENGEVGLSKAIELTPDLILSDMMMPKMDGFTLCTTIRADERISHIPFILLTARTTIESKLLGLELGADEYMTKPFNIREVQVRIKNLLEQRKNLRRSYAKQVTLQPKNISLTSVDERFLNHALEVMESHLGDQQFSVERFAEEMAMSRKNLLRKIKAMTDESVNEFIRNFRLKRAAQLIQAHSGSVSEIAYQVGFNNLSYFSKCFKELFGIRPTEMGSQSSLKTQ